MRHRVAIGGIHIESGTFSPLRSSCADFLTNRGGAVLERYPFLADPEFADIEPLPLAHFRALPGGMVRHEDYQRMKSEILERLAALAPAPDAFYFDVHGAMVVEGLEDAEADLLAGIRAGLPPGALVTCSQDLHGNVSAGLVDLTDIITAYRTAPHIDFMATRERAMRLLTRAWREGVRPVRARVGIPVLVSGEMSSTTTEPGRSLYAPLAEESARPGVWDASLWVGYAWADQARSMACAVVTGTDAAAVRETAAGIAQRYWDARHEFRFVSDACGVAEGIRRGLAAADKPVFLSDAGDNPTGGAAGDVPAVLAALLENPALREGAATAIYASMPDADAIATLRAIPPGTVVSLALGGKLDPLHGRALPVAARLLSFHPGDNPQAVLEAGGIRMIVTQQRRPYHRRADFLELGLEPLEVDLCVVKIGYLEPELAAMARGHLLLVSPGGVPPMLADIPYQHLSRPMFPMDAGFAWHPQPELFP